MNHSSIIVLGVMAGFGFFVVGCQPAPTTGGDSPVTTQRLTGSRLTDIRRDLSWTFDDTTVVIENRGQPIPPDLVHELLGNSSAPKRVEAVWRYDENTGMLHLSDATADGEEIATELVISIKPAGHVRVNLGGRQYNLFRVSTKNP
jgi:hypothetical protein